MVRNYEAAWNQMFYEMPSWRQDIIINEPHGRHAGELASLAAKLAEKGKLLGNEKYNNIGQIEFKPPATPTASGAFDDKPEKYQI